MADLNPWLDSDSLIAAIKRKISFPIFQTTFSEEDVLAFATEEMMISQVPSVLSVHEEYYTYEVEVPIVTNKKKYSIPERAIGMKLRDVFFKDSNGNLFEMTRIAQDDRGFFQRNTGTNQSISKYFLQGNDIVLSYDGVVNNGGSLLFIYFIRPSRLVKNNRAATIDYFTKSVTVNNASIVAGDTVTINGIVFTAVAAAPTVFQFLIGPTSVATAENLAGAVVTSGIILSATTGSPSTNVVKLGYEDIETTVSVSNPTGTVLQQTQGIEFESVPSNIVDGSVIDFLQTRPGHKIKKIDIKLSAGSISANNISFQSSSIPTDIVVGDYICLANECIIPYLPTDLHTALAERTCARILAAIGDQQGLASVNEKIADIEVRQGNILNNRVEGSIVKVRTRNSLIALGKISTVRRRF